MTYLVIAVMTVVFTELFIASNLLTNISTIGRTSKNGINVLTSPNISDDEKEKAMRRMSIDIAKATLLFISKFFLITLLLYSLYYAFTFLSLITKEEFVSSILSYQILIGTTLFAASYILVRNAIRKQL